MLCLFTCNLLWRMIVADIDEADVSRYWDENSATWADQVRKGFDIYREVLNNPAIFEMIGPVVGKRILDIGCGEGHNTRILARAGAKVTGIDISPNMIAYATAAEVTERLGIRYQTCSFSKMAGIKSRSFDMVVAFMSLMDGSDYKGAISEIHRVLKPWGQLVFSLTHPCFLTRGLTWTIDENGQATRLSVGDYFDHTAGLDRWRFSLSPEAAELPDFQVPRFPRTLSDYLNGLIVAGFVILEVREPVPSVEACKKYPKLERWRTHAAISLHVRALKPYQSPWNRHRIAR
jgi:2-polyprenyl-3-methyl-5-hydroxy-6-metoxy-1,4-benzoquinol methylase